MTRRPRQNQRMFDRARRRWFRRFTKKAAAGKYRRQRVLGAFLLLSVVIYLAAAGYVWKFCFYLKQDKQIEYIRKKEADSPANHRELYRIRFSPDTGELTLQREWIDELEKMENVDGFW